MSAPAQRKRTPPIRQDSEIVVGERNARTVQLGERLFTVTSYEDAVKTMDLKFLRCGVVAKDIVCIDAQGRICRRDLQFQRAHQENAFPVTVYHINPPAQS